jgi:hypothetical protein
MESPKQRKVESLHAKLFSAFPCKQTISPQYTAAAFQGYLRKKPREDFLTIFLL